jgi:hypothetical protein
MQYYNRSTGESCEVPVVDEPEIDARLALVRGLKARHGGRELTPWELDTIVEPIDSKRTRDRLSKPHPERTEP